jgi:teichuronic acid biosynthesis glycosyltransferase TuaH
LNVLEPSPLVVVASGVSWDGVKGSARRLAEALVAHADVLWVDPPVSPVTPARYRGGTENPRTWRPVLRPLCPELTRLTPVALPGLSRPVIRSMTSPAVRAQVRWALRRLGRRPVAVLAYSPDDVLGRWGAGVTNVLYGTDDWVAGARLMRLDPRRQGQKVRIALARADLVLVVSPELGERWSELGADPVLLPNGCDASAYADVPGLQPAEMPEGFPTPVAGVVGQLSDRINLGLLEAVVDAGIGLLLVGPRDSAWQPQRVATLLARHNVHHTGLVPFEELPRWFAGLDVGLTPYADTPFNRASFPLKTLEYLAAGLPVVSTDLPASRRLQAETGEVRLAVGGDAFVRAVLAAAGQSRTAARIAERQAVAHRHSWANRAETLAGMLGIARQSTQRNAS